MPAATTARNWAGLLFAEAARQGERADRFLAAELFEKEKDREQFLSALEQFARRLYQREQERKAKEKEKKTPWGALGGAGGGAALGALLAPATGGLSVGAGALLGAGAGAEVGSTFDPQPATGEAISRTLGNPYYLWASQQGGRLGPFGWAM